MYLCTVCTKSFHFINGLILHLKTIHNFTVNSNFLCGQSGCVRSYNNIYSFKRHLKSKHKDENQSTEHLPSTNNLNSNVVNQTSNSNLDSSTSFSLPDSVTDLEPPISTEKLQSLIKNSTANFLSKLYNNNIVTKAHVQDIVSNTTEFLSSGFLDLVKNEVLTVLADYNVEDSKVKKLTKMFKIIEQPFLDLNTEYKRQKFFSTSGLLIAPQQYPIGHAIRNKHSNIETVQRTGQFIPLRQVLKSFLELPNVFQNILSYISELKSSTTLSNVMQGSLWKSICKNKENLILPLFLYFDDYETNNPLGSHAGTHKLGAVYVSLPCIPPQFRSQLKNIFLALLFHSSDRSDFGNVAVFQILIDELQFLFHTGINVECNGYNGKVYFAVSNILGDNLGVHSVLGFSESFSANFPCRLCKTNKEDMKKMCKEDPMLVRSVQSYESDVQTSTLRDSGIKEKAVWNELPYFHAVVNTSCDIMHDLYEGVCRYDMCHVIIYCLDNKFFTLDILNNRLDNFDYGPVGCNNKPPKITQDKLKNRNLGFSASEMLCFVQNFSMVVGDLIPYNDDVWFFYLLLVEIVHLANATSVQHDTVYLLETLIEEHNEMYISLFKDTLKPKHHFLVHYPKLILSIGPLVHVSSMRYEAKHKEFKQAAHVCSCRINLPFTLANKHQLKLCFRLHTKEGLYLEKSVGICDEVKITDIMEERGIVSEPPSELLEVCLRVSWAKNGGIIYKPSLVVIIDENDYFLYTFARIEFVLVSQNRNIYLMTRLYNTSHFESHFNAYEVTRTNEWQLLSIDSLFNVHPTFCHKLPNGKLYISVK